MKILFINSVYGVRSTGRIVSGQCRALREHGHECVAAYGQEARDDGAARLIRIGTDWDLRFHGLRSRLLDQHGYGSGSATRRFLRQIEKEHFDLIWLHNIHGYYLRVDQLFAWLREHPEIPVRWTLHDCWAFTGHCAYFSMVGCEKWRDACGSCPQLRTYPKSLLLDHSEENLSFKRRAFSGVKDLTLITPSRWLADLTRESFLRQYPVEVVYNEVDPAVFHPTPGNFRARFALENRRIVLGVAVGWEETKGIQDLIALRGLLDERFEIVVVGNLTGSVRRLPEGMLHIPRTETQSELAEIYTAADVFVNPTHQDNYPTVNLEAAACGTPVVTYRVGGSPESVPPENVVAENDIAAMASRIQEICG